MDDIPEISLPQAPPFTDLRRHEFVLPALRVLRCQMRISTSQLKYLSRTGAYWARPILERPGAECLALRLQPGVPLCDSPLLLFSGREAATLSQDARDLVPAVLAWDAAADRDAWKALGKLTAEDWDSLSALHELCGGRADLSVLRRLIGQSSLLKRVHGKDAAARERAVCDFMVQSLPQSHHQVYRRYLDELRLGGGDILPLPQAGPFGAAVAARAFLQAQQQEGDRDALIATACAVFAHPPALDTAVLGESGQVCVPDALAGDNLRYEAAQALKERAEGVPEAFRQSPMWPAIVELGSGEILADCDGRVFWQAAQASMAQGSPDAAFHCLLWSSACSYSNAGRSDIATLHAAVDLAKAAGWGEIHQTLLVMLAQRDPDEEARHVERLDALAARLIPD